MQRGGALNMGIYIFLDWFFIVFHTAWTLFNLTGWMWRQARPYHLATSLITAASWFILGYFYGWGYCCCTDWHWRVREILGKDNSSYSFVHYAVKALTGTEMDPYTVDMAVLSVFLVTLSLSIVLNFRDYRKRSNEKDTLSGN